MFRESHAYPSFSIDDVRAAWTFYAGALGIDVTEGEGILYLHPGGGSRVVAEVRADHVPSCFPVLNFPVTDIDLAADRLLEAGIRFERRPGVAQDEWGIARRTSVDDGPPTAWFRDPAGNLLAIIELPGEA